MKDSRRDFLKKAALLAGGAGIWNALPASVYKAMAISPDPGTTFMDAEHIVILMQENRSFDHCFGKLKGVRGFNDPRAIHLPNKNLVWLQSDKSGQTFAPFRFNINDTKATWMRGIPHSWEDQVDARNDGKYDAWIEAKRSGRKEFSHIPMTMGFYDREDIPFYYAFADAFTVCDQHFCAALTGTTTNRNYLWAGKTHGNPGDKPKVRNSELTYGKEVSWNTFPEKLQDHGISWKVYQNEVSVGTLLEGEDESLLANFTDNNLEWFSQFGVRFSPGHYEYLRHHSNALPKIIKDLEKKVKTTQGEEKEMLEKELDKKRKLLASVQQHLKNFNPSTFNKLSAREKELHQRAFAINNEDPDYHKTELLEYMEEGEKRATKIPKGDILHGFRKDVDAGDLPTVSWLVAPQKFSDHPSAPWYGAWYVSEVLEILTKNPEVWKKTIFILNYDENDGYFDHIPPFVPPKPGDESTGKMSEGLDASGEYVTLQQELDYPGMKPENARESPVGLGYRVPLIVASPWSRGGWVNSEVCDISSTIMLMEKILSHKTGKEIKETNISSWRRNICGDLTTVFRPYNGEILEKPEPVDMKEHVKKIYNASFKDLPNNFKALDAQEIKQINADPLSSPWTPKQEAGTKPSCSLPYELYADGNLTGTSGKLKVVFRAANEVFGPEAKGAPFHVYAPGNYRQTKGGFAPVRTWAFAVRAGDQIEYEWPLEDFEGQMYHLNAYGPNGFFREFRGYKTGLSISIESQKTNSRDVSGYFKLRIGNPGSEALSLVVEDISYHNGKQSLFLEPGRTVPVNIPTASSYGWYDFSVSIENHPSFLRRYAGRLENGKASRTDPLMGMERAMIKS